MPTYRSLEVVASPVELELPSVTEEGWKEFDCPQCVPMVPYRRVRAKIVATAYEAGEYGKFQAPIERGLAARFGEYLMREGLIRFTTQGSADFGSPSDKITVIAHLGVVSRAATERAGAVEEVAMTAAPALPKKLARQLRERAKSDMIGWRPPKRAGYPPDDPVTDEFDEPKDALGARFSGLEI